MSRRRELVLLAAILCAYCVLFGRAVTYEYVWDDVPEIHDSAQFDAPLWDGILSTQTERTEPELTELVGAELAYDSYRPLLFTSYWLEVRAFGRSAAAMHAVNILLGALAIACVWALARRCVGPGTPGLLAATMFALHPVQVEPVVYISGRGDLLAGLFALCACLCVFSWIDRRRPLSLSIALLAFAASLFTKESCLGLPVAVAALLWAKHELRAHWRVIVAMLAVAGGYLVIRMLVVVSTTSSALVRGLAALPGICLEYVRIALFPFDLSTERLHETSYVWPGWALAFVIAVLLVCVARGRGRSLRAAGAGVVWFIALLAPSAVAIAGSTGVLADRYLYAPLAGMAITLVAGAQVCVRASPRLVRPVGVLACLWALMLVVVAWRQVPVWRNNQTLYAHAVAMAPDSSEAHYRLAYLAAREDDWQRAIPLLERAVQLDPRNVRALVNLGVGKLRTGHPAEAERMFERAVVVNPAAFRAWLNLGLAKLSLGKTREGCWAVARALAINPRYAFAVRSQDTWCRPKTKYPESD